MNEQSGDTDTEEEEVTGEGIGESEEEELVPISAFGEKLIPEATAVYAVGGYTPSLKHRVDIPDRWVHHFCWTICYKINFGFPLAFIRNAD